MDEYLLILKVAVTLTIVALLAYFLIRFLLRRLQPGLGAGYVKIIQKVPLDIKGGMSLILIHVGEEVLLLGASTGSITVLKEFSPEMLAREQAGSGEAFTDIFSKLLARYKERAGSRKEGSG